MGIMAMATGEKTNKVNIKTLILSVFITISPLTIAGEWSFSPYLSLTENLNQFL